VTIAREIEVETSSRPGRQQLVREVATVNERRRRRRHDAATLLAPGDRARGPEESPPVRTRWGSSRHRRRRYAVCREPQVQSTEISGKEDNARVATVSSRSPEIGEVPSEAIEKVGKDGVVNVEEGQTFGLELEFTEGHAVRQGYLSPYMVPDAERMEAVLENPSILVANQKIGAVKDLLPVLEAVIQAGRPLLDSGRGREGERSRRSSSTKRAAHLPAVAVKAPGFGDRRKRMLEDHRHPHGRGGDHRGDGPQAREHEALGSSARPAASSSRRTRRRSLTVR